MISAATLYKHLKKWTCQPRDHRGGWFNNIVFAGDKVFATNTHRLVVVKNYPCAPHLETGSGQMATDSTWKPEEITNELLPKALKVIPSDKSCQYSAVISPLWFGHMKNAFDFIKKAAKRKSTYEGACALNAHDGKLYALSAGDDYGAKFLLADNTQSDDVCWGCWNAAYLFDAMDLVVDTKPTSMKFSIQFNRMADSPITSNYTEEVRWTGIWKIETPELIMISTSLRISNTTTEMDDFMSFMEDEAIRPDNKAAIVEKAGESNDSERSDQ